MVFGLDPAGSDVTWLLPLLEEQLQRRVVLLGPNLLGDPTGERYRIHPADPARDLHEQIADATLTAPIGESLLVLTDTGTLLPQLTRPDLPEVLFALEDQRALLTSYTPHPTPPLPPERTLVEWHAFELARTTFERRDRTSGWLRLPTFGATEPRAVTLAAARLLADYGVLDITSSGLRITDPAGLLTFATRDYRAAGGLSSFWEHPGTAAAQVVALMNSGAVLLSGTYAAHRYVSTATTHRPEAADEAIPEPRQLVAYAHTPVDLRPHGFRPAPATRATLELVWPADPTIHRTAPISPAWEGLVDPVLALADTIRTTTHTDPLPARLRLRLLRGDYLHPTLAPPSPPGTAASPDASSAGEPGSASTERQTSAWNSSAHNDRSDAS
ncbi:hypothetical protein [Curtobacterium ammoniigenes]|uniref:hypothetical protein n=1 Tax=Curtobacterium ammoniigenes TaxID=395387 RepID=UPI00083114BF|nr:hypothetical protein [Curtobacterium ammoniigenes]